MLNQVKEKIQKGELIHSITKTIRNRFLVAWNSVRYGNAFYFLDPERVITKEYIDTLTPAPAHLNKYSNYSLHPDVVVNAKSLVYSLGIFRDASFDLAIANKTGCNVHLFDPTPATVEYMKQFESNKQLHYHPIGVWIRDEELTFYQGKEDTSSSVFNGDGIVKKVHFKATCKTIPTIMKAEGHKHIDVLKMDIEGAALPVCMHIFEHGIFPTQIVGEFERPLKNMTQVKDFIKSIDELVQKMHSNGYKVFALPREQAYYSVELLAVRKTEE